jgi:hypothetical protein
MNYYIVIYNDGSIKIFKIIQDKALLPSDARQFVCSSNVTVQDLFVWMENGYKGINSIGEIASSYC